jgi:phage/plasmid-like protein (TIGR03299 family)
MNNVLIRPWDKAGVNVDGLTAKEAMVKAGLDWRVEKQPVYVLRTDEQGRQRAVKVPDKYSIVRQGDDKLLPLSVVGSSYKPYQNESFFEFLDKFLEQSNTRLDAVGAFNGGRVLWASAFAGMEEYIPGDPAGRFLIIRNTHDGSGMLEVAFSNVRVTCNNMVVAMFRKSQSRFAITHTINLESRLDVVNGVIRNYQVHYEELNGIMKLFASKTISQKELISIVTRVFGRPKTPPTGEIIDLECEEIFTVPKAKDKVLELAEIGMGTEIPGVRGSVYGAFNAVTEYIDHHRKVLPAKDRSVGEARFESILAGTGSRLKQKAFEQFLQLAS